MNRLIYILGIILLILIIIVALNKKHNKIFSLSQSNSDPITLSYTDNLCSKSTAFMSIEKNPTFLLIKPKDGFIGECNINLHLFKYDGQNINIDSVVLGNTISKFGTINNNSIKTDNTLFIPAPLKIMNIRLDDLKSHGGLYYDHTNIITPITPMNCDMFKLGPYTLTLIEPYANTRQQSDKMMLFKGNSGLIGEIHGYRDKDQKFIIEWICWKQNNNYLNYGTIMSNP